MGLGETAQLVARLSLKDDFSRGLRTAEGNLNRFGKTASRIGTHVGQGLRSTASNLQHLAVVGIGAFATGITAAVKIAGDFEAQLNTINTIARTDAAGLGKIGDQIRAVARDTGTPLEELTQGYYDLLSAGIKAADAQNVLTAANKLAIGGLATTAETIDLLTTAINTYGGDASKAANYADVFAKAVERGKVTADEIAASFATVGSVAAASGIEINEIAAAYARLTSAGVPASEVATQMRSAIIALTRRTSDLKKLETQTGKSYLAIAGQKGLVVALQEMRADADKAGIPLIELLGRVEGLNFTLQTTGDNFGKYNQDLAAMGDASGTAAAQMAERQQGLNFQLARLGANVKDVGITIGTALLPPLAELTGEMADFLRDHQADIAQFGKDLAGGLKDAVGWAKQLDWEAIAGAAKGLANFGKTLAQGFMAMPTEAKELLLGLFALNKLSGGAVIKIGVDLAGGLVGGLGRAMGSALAGAGLGKLFVQPVFVTNMGVGGVGGGAAAGGGGSAIATAAGTAGIGAAVAGGALSVQDIRSGTEEGTRRGLSSLMGGAPGLIGRAVEEAIGDPIGDAIKAIRGISPKGQLESLRHAVQTGDDRQLDRQMKTIAALNRLESIGAGTTDAIRNKDLSVSFRPDFTTTVKVSAFTSVSVRDVNRSTTTHSTYNATFANRMTRLGIF